MVAVAPRRQRSHLVPVLRGNVTRLSPRSCWHIAYASCHLKEEAEVARQVGKGLLDILQRCIAVGDARRRLGVQTALRARLPAARCGLLAAVRLDPRVVLHLAQRQPLRRLLDEQLGHQVARERGDVLREPGRRPGAA